MKRIEDKDLDVLSELYRKDPLPSREVDMERYERKVKEQDEKFGKYDEVGRDKHKSKPIEAVTFLTTPLCMNSFHTRHQIGDIKHHQSSPLLRT